MRARFDETNLLRLLGAELELTPAARGMSGAINFTSSHTWGNRGSESP